MTTYPKILSVTPLEGYQLLIIFQNRKAKIYDCADLLKHSAFAMLRDPAMFRAVQVDTGGYGIRWNDDLDLSESELWLHGRFVKMEDYPDILHVQQAKAQKSKLSTLDEVKQQFLT